MNSRSLADQLALANTIIYNVKNHAIIQQKLVEWGYPITKVNQAETLLNSAQLAQQAQQDSYHSKRELERRYQDELSTVRARYSEHRAVAKVIFRNQPDVLSRLLLNQRQPRRQSDWLAQMQAFYQLITEYSKDMQKLGIKAEELAQTQTMLTGLSELRAQRLQCKGDAESATEKRNQLLAELRGWQQEFIQVAKMALKDDPQLLEMLGIAVAA